MIRKVLEKQHLHLFSEEYRVRHWRTVPCRILHRLRQGATLENRPLSHYLQSTLKTGFTYKGIALHCGMEVSIRCLPSRADSGIVFRRTDMERVPEIKASSANIITTVRSTCIGVNGYETCVNGGEACVNAVEHLMAAFCIMGVDNAVVEINGGEVPAGDGSALTFTELIAGSGIKILDKPLSVKKVNAPLYVRDGGALLAALPFEGLRFSYTLSYDHPHVGTQYGDYIFDKEFFVKEIAPSRTFGFADEIDKLRTMGLALGGTPDNAVLITRDGPLQQLRFKDEQVRHKILDMVGDLYLSGRLQGHFIGIKSGHGLNACLSRMLANQL